jgi:hypothetical protein
MRLIIEWLDKDDKVLFKKDQLPSISFGGTVQVTPVIPEVTIEINLPGFPTIKGIMDEAANKYVRESISSFRIRVLEDEPEPHSPLIKELALKEAKEFIDGAENIEMFSVDREIKEVARPDGIITKHPSGYETLKIRRRVHEIPPFGMNGG